MRELLLFCVEDKTCQWKLSLYPIRMTFCLSAVDFFKKLLSRRPSLEAPLPLVSSTVTNLSTCKSKSYFLFLLSMLVFICQFYIPHFKTFMSSNLKELMEHDLLGVVCSLNKNTANKCAKTTLTLVYFKNSKISLT